MYTIDIHWPGQLNRAFEKFFLFGRRRDALRTVPSLPVRIDGRVVARVAVEGWVTIEIPEGAREVDAGYWFMRSQRIKKEELTPGRAYAFYEDVNTSLFSVKTLEMVLWLLPLVAVFYWIAERGVDLEDSPLILPVLGYTVAVIFLVNLLPGRSAKLVAKEDEP